MADWTAQYLAALVARDELGKADADIYDRCTKLADSNAQLKAEIRKLRASASASPASTSPAPVPAPLISYGFRRQASSPQVPTESETLQQLRQDFAVAQQERADLQSHVAAMKTEADKLAASLKGGNDQISKLQHMNTRLSTRLKDREEELKGKARLLENVQDENATLNLELIQAEGEVKRVKKENEDLVERWVKRMGKEADKMNEEGGFA